MQINKVNTFISRPESDALACLVLVFVLLSFVPFPSFVCSWVSKFLFLLGLSVTVSYS